MPCLPNAMVKTSPLSAIIVPCPNSLCDTNFPTSVFSSLAARGIVRRGMLYDEYDATRRVGCVPPWKSRYLSSISVINRDGELYCREPNTMRVIVLEITARRRARVIATYANLRSSSISPLPIDLSFGKMPSSHAGR